MMRIGFDFRMGGSINSGIGRYVFELLKHVAAADPGISYVVFYNERNVDEADLAVLKSFANIELVATRARHYSLAEQTTFLRELNRHNLDLVHFPNFNVPVGYKRPYVVTIHDMVHHKISGHKPSRLLHFQAYKYIIRSAAHRARTIITVTEVSKQEIIHYLGVPSEKIRVIAEAPSLEKASLEQVEEVKKKYFLSRPYFLFVGTLERKKNVVTLARGFDEFMDKHKLNVDLVIAGKPDRHYPEIKHQALDIRHRDHIVFTDYVADKDLAALYQGAYAFVTASLHEGFGLPGVEAMQFGLPLLAANTKVFNEVYDDAAIYFDPESEDDIAENMYLLARDPKFHEQLQEKSFRRAQLFSWEEAAAQTLAVYKEAYV